MFVSIRTSSGGLEEKKPDLWIFGINCMVASCAVARRLHLSGIARMIYVYGDSLDEDAFKERVGKLSAKNIVRTAKDRRPGVLGYAEAMVMAYNAKTKFGLSMKKLYWNGKKKDDQEDNNDEA